VAWCGLAATLAVLPLAGFAAPVTVPYPASSNPRIVSVQNQGWWGREGRPDELRERYWRFPPPEGDHSDELTKRQCKQAEHDEQGVSQACLHEAKDFGLPNTGGMSP